MTDESLPAPSKRKTPELTDQYGSCFSEWSTGGASGGIRSRSGSRKSPPKPTTTAPTAKGAAAKGAPKGGKGSAAAKQFTAIVAVKASETKSVIPFVKIALPDHINGCPDLPLQPLKTYPNAFRYRFLFITAFNFTKKVL